MTITRSRSTSAATSATPSATRSYVRWATCIRNIRRLSSQSWVRAYSDSVLFERPWRRASSRWLSSEETYSASIA